MQETGTIHAYTPGPLPVPALTIPGVHFDILSPDQIPALATAMRSDISELRRRLAQGGLAAIARTEEGVIAGYGWVSLDAVRIYELGVRIPLPAGHAYIWDCVTLPPFRGRGIFAGLLRFLMEELRQDRGKQVWAAVAPGNVISQRAFARAGFRLVAETRLIDSKIDIRLLPEATRREVAALRRINGTPVR